MTSTNPRGLALVARLLSDLGAHRLSADLLHYQWRRGTRSTQSALAIANARLATGQNAQAIAFFREVCRRAPEHTEARGGLVCALFRQGSVGDAAREAAVLAEFAPSAEAWVLVAELRKRLGDTIGSLDAFRKAAAAGLAPARFLLGDAIFGEEVWSDLVAPLASIHASRPAVGVGTHLVRSRATLVARAMSRRRNAAVLTAMASLLGASAPAQDATPSPSPTPAEGGEKAVVRALPSAGSLTARAVQLNAGLVLEREEGVGLFPAEPSRFAFRGGSWTQSRIEIDGFDVTDPILGGRPLVWGSVEQGEVEVRTDSKGTVLIHNHPPSTPGDGMRFAAQANIGLFDSTGSTSDPIPSLARGRRLSDGFLALSSAATGDSDTTWSAAVSGTDVSRSERDSDRERASRRLGLEGRIVHRKGVDRFQGLGMYQARRAPFGLTEGETEAKGMALGGAWQRTAGRVGRDPHARMSFLRGQADDPTFSAPVNFERLVDGPADFLAPYRSVSQRLQAEAGMTVARPGETTNVSVLAHFSHAAGERGLTQPVFLALETLNPYPARQWTFAGSRPSRLAEARAGLALSFSTRPSERTRLSGRLEAQRATVGDRDGGRLAASNDFLPELRFEWSRSETTTLFAEASMGTPPVPLISYEAAAGNAPAVSARLWSDPNHDGRVSASELGIEVARRGPGLVTVDPNLRLPIMRRVIIGLATRVWGVRIRATAFARRDIHLLETALDPQGSEVQSTRNLPDPSGDIVGPSDDQILPLVLESRASFSSSRILLTNPASHRALGEGAELAFETSSRHVHWGLVGAAFRDSGRGGNRGLRVGENDFGVVGEAFDRTNADTFGYGRLFFDRAYSLRMYLTASEVRGFTFGAIGRYDDGQPFARLVIQNDLPQGPDFVQAIPRGRARLHYTLSVDARLARRFKVANTPLEVSATVFNALGSRFEAEEQVVWLPDYRRITMVQPPRAFVIGLRIGH